MSLEDRLSEKVMPIPESGCWVWTGKVEAYGHGRMGYRGGHYVVSRLAYEHYVGAIPDGMKVCHKCDVPSCINPNHLFLSTDKGNHDDAVSKGRKDPSEYGKKNSVYTRKNNRKRFVELREKGFTLKQISEISGMSYKAVNRWAQKLKI